MDNIMALVGRYFQINRKLQGFTCKYVSEVTGIERSYLSKIENGHVPLSIERFVTLCNFYDLEPGAFLDAALQEQKTGVKTMSSLAARIYK